MKALIFKEEELKVLLEILELESRLIKGAKLDYQEKVINRIIEIIKNS